MSTSPYDAAGASPPGIAKVLADVTEMVRRALSDYGEWPGSIAPNARLDADLGMQSIELWALQSQLEQRWDDAGDLTPLLRTLDLAGLAGLTVTDVATWVAAGGAFGWPAAGPAGAAADPTRDSGADPTRDSGAGPTRDSGAGPTWDSGAGPSGDSGAGPAAAGSGAGPAGTGSGQP